MSTYSIKQVSKQFQLPSSTLRYYEDEGLLTDIKRTASGQRIYEDKHIHRLRTICCFKHAGMPISLLKEFFSLREDDVQDVEKILVLLSKHELHLEEEIEELQRDLVHIQKKLCYYKAVNQALKEGKGLPLWSTYRNG